MNKYIFAFTAVVALLSAVSCQEEIEISRTASGPMVINALSAGMDFDTKVEMAYRYDLLWQTGDRIYVTDGRAGDTFTLSGGAGTTKGTFTQDGSVSLSGDVEAFCPMSLAQGGSLIWPSVQSGCQTVPMYSRKTVAGNVEDFNFASLGAVLQIVFNSTVEGVVLKSVIIKDGRKGMSGSFSVDGSGKAVITSTDRAGVTLDLGQGKVLGKGANYFNLAIPAGKYEDVTISFISADMKVCSMHSSTLPEIGHNTVCRVTLTGTSFGSNTLPGEFSVGGGRVVGFSKGNLYWNGSTYEFEPGQYDYPTTRSSSHMGHFFWSCSPGVARASSYSDSGRGEHDVFFTNSTEVTPSADFTVAGIRGRFRTLSMTEWEYLMTTRSNAASLRKLHVTVCGVEECLVIAPDSFTGQIKDSYSAEEWASAEAGGLVCLPPAGYTVISGTPYGDVGYYWSSAPWTISGAQFIAFMAETSGVVPLKRENVRDYGCAVRLVRDKEYVTGVKLNRTTLELPLRQSLKLTAEVQPSTAPVRNVVWTSDNPDVVTVAADGTVYGAAVGTATVTATSENAFKTASCTVTVQPFMAGQFSVSSSRKVRFSKGNLYWDGDSYEFESNQYDFPTARSSSHTGHFFWSCNPGVARASYYSDPDRGEHDVFFTNAEEDTAGPDFTAGGLTGRFRTLSMLEWKYLFNTRSNSEALHKLHVTVCGVENCLVIAPDGFTGQIMDSYSAEEWRVAEDGGLVCLPPAGYSLTGSNPSDNVGYYWSSAPWTMSGAQFIGYTEANSSVVSRGSENTRNYCCAVRLVTDAS